MLVVDGFKLIHSRGTRFELYSLREDRGETSNLVADPNHKVAFEALRRRLKAFERRDSAGTSTDRTSDRSH